MDHGSAGPALGQRQCGICPALGRCDGPAFAQLLAEVRKMSARCRTDVGPMLARGLPDVGPMSALCLQAWSQLYIVGQALALARHRPNIDPTLAQHRPNIGPTLAQGWANTGQAHWPSIGPTLSRCLWPRHSWPNVGPTSGRRWQIVPT